MPSWILETYVTRLTPDGLRELVQRSEQAAIGSPVRHIRSYFVPDDDMCMHVFEGPTADAVRTVARVAGLESERIVQSVGEIADLSTGRDR